MKKTKLVITIPCHNEAQSLPEVIKSIPKKIKGVSKTEIIVIDDGSTDQTLKVAKKVGVKHFVIHKKRQGLAQSFADGLQKALKLKADVIVNTDGDNQYDQAQIPQLIEPVLKDQADMVLGNRQVKKLTHMPPAKKIGNLFGSWVVRKLTGVKIQDASTGFRAFSRPLTQSFYLISGHTYTHETIIHAHYNSFRLKEIPVKFKKRKHGQSRLIAGIWPHLKSSAAIIVRTILIYKAFKYLALLGLGIMSLGFLGTLRFFWFYLNKEGSGHIQSLIFSSILISLGFSTLMMGILADLIGLNRKLIEKSQSGKNH